jgi:hypothetical protein
MNDDTKLRALLRQAAAGDPLDATDPEPVARRGETTVRRRRTAGVVTAVAAVAAVTWGANSLTGIDSSDGTPPVATDATQATTSAAARLFEPLPGVGSGEAALGPISDAEATRRCELRHPNERRVLARVWGGYRGGGRGIYSAPPPTTRDPVECGIPGDSRPTRHAISLVDRDRLPVGDTGKLRNCSVRLWHDITGWRILTAETEPGELMNFVAISPSGRYVARCSLTKNPNANGLAGTGIGLTNPPPDPHAKAHGIGDPLEHFPVAGSKMCGRPCIGWLHDEIGRVDPRIARIRVVKPNGRVHDIKVVNGWYAFAWADRDPKGGPDADVTTYDAAGRVIKKYN